MSTPLDQSEIPRDADGIVLGRYLIRSRSSGGWIEEVGERAVGGPELLRLEAAFGPLITFEPADAETAEAVARHIFETTGNGKRAKQVRAPFARPTKAKKGPGQKRGKKGGNGSPGARTA